LPFSGTFHFDEGYYYFRNIGNRVLLGGARNKAFEMETSTELEITNLVQDELEHFLRERILAGKQYTIDHRWSGIMGFTNSKLPVIEQVEPGVYSLVTCNGMGVALSPIMAEKAAALMFE
jgi:glycine/D-amino acid oxidase-like deaminating enzyme